MPRQPAKPSTSAKILYRPIGIVGGIVSGLIASLVFKQVWKRVGSDDAADAPGPLQSEYSFKEILVASALHGALFAVVRAVVQRQGARAFQRATGEWPGS